MSDSPVAILYDSAGTEKGTGTNPVKVDPTGTTAQPVSATALPLPSGAATSAAQTDGTQKTQVTVLPVLPSGTNTIGKVDQGTGGSNAWKVDGSGVTQPVSATALPLPTGAATSAAQTDGSQKAIVRGGAKGTTVAADVTSESVDTNTQALHVKMVGGGSGVGTNVNIVDPSGNPIATADGSAPATTRGLMVEGYESAGAVAHRLAVDSLGRLVTAPSGAVSSQAGFAFGDVALSAVTSAVVNRTTYAEQTTNAQRSIASANAADAAAGTGARQVKITYLDQTGAGPYTETVTLNGTTGVNTVATNICLIEKMEVVSVGSGGNNAGIITLYTAINKGGTAIGTIAATDNRTLWDHHYVPTGKTCNITGLACCSNSSVAGNGSVFTIRAHSIPGANIPVVQVSDFVTIYGQTSNVERLFGTPIKVSGPAHVEGWVTTFVNNALIYRASFDYYDQ
jgi:hypothetical protein